MATVPKSLSKGLRLTVDYDRSADVLYIANGKPRPAEGEGFPGGIVRRYALEDNSACGVTVLGYCVNRWPERSRELAEIVADHLGGDVGHIQTLIRGAAGAG
jgi:hypothetical protein